MEPLHAQIIDCDPDEWLARLREFRRTYVAPIEREKIQAASGRNAGRPTPASRIGTDGEWHAEEQV